MFDDNMPLNKSGSDIPRNLESMSVAELEHYITVLEGEITRVHDDIKRKKATQTAALSVFKI